MSVSADKNDCTLDTCPLTDSVYQYRPSLAANVVMLVLFAVTLVAHVVQGWIWRQRVFGILMFFGCLTEVIGYVGRIISWDNPFSQTGFLSAVVCLTMAPAFYSAAIYLCIFKM